MKREYVVCIYIHIYIREREREERRAEIESEVKRNAAMNLEREMGEQKKRVEVAERIH